MAKRAKVHCHALHCHVTTLLAQFASYKRPLRLLMPCGAVPCLIHTRLAWRVSQPPQVQLDRTHMIAAHMGYGAPKDMLFTFVIGAYDEQCHKNPIVTIIVGNKRFRKVVPYRETGRLGDWGAPHLEEFLALIACFKRP